MNKKQYNNVIEHTLKHEQTDDSLSTARAIFDNMGVALPQGDMKTVYETISTDNYMGWQSCTMEEAQTAANNGIAAIGISADKIVVISANDEEESTTQTASVMTLSENTATCVDNGMRYYSYDSDKKKDKGTIKETATIKKDGNYSKVVFSNGTVWKCNPSYYNVTTGLNEPIDYQRANYNQSINFSKKQLGFLFRIDPDGVIYYVENKNLGNNATPTDYLMYRDSVFEKIYGKKPRYFTYEDSVLRYQSGIEYDDRYGVYSEAELIFGMLPRWSWQNVIQTILEVGVSIISIYVPQIAIALNLKLLAGFFFTGLYEDSVSAAAQEFISDAVLSGYGDKLTNMFGWATSIAGLIPSLLDTALPPNIDAAQISIYENAYKNESYVVKVSDNGQTVDLNEFIKHYKSLLLA